VLLWRARIYDESVTAVDEPYREQKNKPLDGAVVSMPSLSTVWSIVTLDSSHRYRLFSDFSNV
jgi:hypothetical protein